MSDKLTEIATRHQVFLERLKAGLVNDYKKELQLVEQEIFALLGSQEFINLNEISRTKLNKILVQVKQIQRDGYSKALSSFAKELDLIADNEKDFERKSLQSATSANVARVNNSEAYAKALKVPITANGFLLEEYYQDLEANSVKQIDSLIKQGWKQGWSLQDFKNNYFGNKRGNIRGLINIQDNQVNTFIRTAVQHVSGVARQEVWRSNNDIFDGWKFTATLDNRTSRTCSSLDGTIFEIGDDSYSPPVHPNCRSSSVGVVKEEYELDINDPTRSARDGDTNKSINVSANLDYYEYLQTQSKEYQISALGKSKYNLLAKNGAKWFKKNSVNKYFKPLTLDELKKLDDLQING